MPSSKKIFLFDAKTLRNRAGTISVPLAGAPLVMCTRGYRGQSSGCQFDALSLDYALELRGCIMVALVQRIPILLNNRGLTKVPGKSFTAPKLARFCHPQPTRCLRIVLPTWAVLEGKRHARCDTAVDLTFFNVGTRCHEIVDVITARHLES